MFATLAEDAPPLPKGFEADSRLDAIARRGRELSTQISVLQAELVDLAAETIALKPDLGMTPKSWLAWEWGLMPAESGRICRLARRLQDLPELSAALEDGRISEGVATAIAAVATPDNEHRLLELSQIVSGGQLTTLLRTYKQQTADPRESERVPNLEEWFQTGIDDDGMWRGDIRLSAERGELLESAVRAARELCDETEPSEEDRSVSDETDATTSGTGAGADVDGEPVWERNERIHMTSRVDALMSIVDAFLGGTATTAGVLPDRYQVIVHATPEQLAGGANVDDACHIHGGGPVDPVSLARIMCESALSVIVKDKGIPVTVTSPTRFATREQTKALLVRDRCCSFPACGRSHNLIAHHVQFFEHGGPTSLDNMILLCRAHHRLIHQPGWNIETEHHGTIKRFTRPNGTPVPTANPRRDTDTTDVLDETPEVQPERRHTGCGRRVSTQCADEILSNLCNRPHFIATRAQPLDETIDDTSAVVGF